MTADTVEWYTVPQALTRVYHGFRDAHASDVLRWLRNLMLLCVAASAALYLWVVLQAGGDIAAARRTQQSIVDIDNAKSAAARADNALTTVFSTEAVTLVGTGPEFANQVNEVNRHLTLAAQGNAAGAEGTTDIQNVQDQLVAYLQLSESAVHDYAVGGPIGKAGMSYAQGGESGLLSDIGRLGNAEGTALAAQRRAWALDPLAFWWVLLAPVVGMLLLTMVTEQVLARHFRRHVSPWLWGSLLAVTVVAVVTGIFNADDARALAGDPWASHPATMAIALLLLLAATVQAYLAYRPRLAEYRFQSS